MEETYRTQMASEQKKYEKQVQSLTGERRSSEAQLRVENEALK